MSPQAVLLDALTVPGEPALLHNVREFVARTLGDGFGCMDTAVLLTSELATNSVQHSISRYLCGTITIVVISVADGIRIEVIDNGGATVPALKTLDGGDLAENGRGLQMVEMLSAEWGHYSDVAGTVTWFELAESPAAD